MNICKRLVLASVTLITAQTLLAEELLIDSAITDSYHYLDHYEVMVEATAAEVWPVLVDAGSWMEELAMQHESGAFQAEGETFTLYGDPRYRLQIVKLIPQRMMVAVNLPSRADGEDSVGIAMITLSESDGMTVVSNSMSRQYDWQGEGSNPLRVRRGSEEFRQFNQVLWSSMLSRLKQLVEGQ
jgi:hypothetical protein